jgi:hypothetical protein
MWEVALEGKNFLPLGFPQLFSPSEDTKSPDLLLPFF